MTDDDVRKLIAKRLRGTTQRALAAELGVSAAYICDILKGKRNPGDKILRPLGLSRSRSYSRA